MNDDSDNISISSNSTHSADTDGRGSDSLGNNGSSENKRSDIKQEDNCIRYSKAVVIAALILAAAGVALLTYTIADKAEKDSYDNAVSHL